MVIAELSGKRILVLSDDDRLSRVIELNLSNPAEMQVLSLVPGELVPTGCQIAARDIDLLVVAASSPISEPLVMLAQVSLTGSVGQVPVLIISDRPFRSDPVAMINHLGFPFYPEELQNSITGILGGSTAKAGSHELAGMGREKVSL